MKAINHEYFVSLEVAKLLKEAGFDWNCYKLYEREYERDGIVQAVTSANWNSSLKYYSASTLDVVQRWLREIKCIHLYVRPILDERKYVVTVVVDDLTWGQVNDNTGTAKRFNTYEEAQESGIKKALEIILEKG